MGQIPARDNMISTIITFPLPGDTIRANSDFTISFQSNHLQAGSFTNPTVTYYSSPQELARNGDIIGHAHITIQDIGSLRSTTPPDPRQFAFFKGVNDPVDANGLLSATVPGGLPAGAYRACTMVSSSNHQPVLMPVAQRGAQDDCVKFEVVNGGNANNGNNNNNNNGGNNNNNGGNNAGNNGGRGRGRNRARQ